MFPSVSIRERFKVGISNETDSGVKLEKQESGERTRERERKRERMMPVRDEGKDD